jgi:HAMP domain-containing protein
LSLSGIPARGVPLGLRLGLTTSVIVTLVLGVLTGVVQKREIERGREDRRLLLEQTLAPLAADVEEAADLPTVQARLSHFQVAHFSRGHGSIRVVLLNSAGRVVATPLTGPAEPPPKDSLTARVPIRSRLLPDNRGELEIWQDEARFREMAARRWRQWLLSLGVAAVCILASLYFAYVFLIERPLRRLLEGVKQMEQGYWSGLEIPRGAWEMRWLAYRFRNLGTQLEETVRRLVEAERRTVAGLRTAPAPAPAARPAGEGPSQGASMQEEAFRRRILRRYLVARCRFLASRAPSDPAARAAAHEVWERDAHEAQRLGESPLKSRLEDAAFRILEPDAYADVSRRAAGLTKSRRNWIRDREAELKAALAEAGVKPRALQHRVKHLAGIWRKMKSKGLAIEQIHDIFAFRILLETEEECYMALSALHHRFEALLLRFKDYIAEPKENGYQSLHTCIRAPGGLVYEVQIRTLAMHALAEGGGAAHWKYKKDGTVETDEDDTPQGVLVSLTDALRRRGIGG